MLSMIAALTKNRVISVNGKIPWNIPEDLLWFKKCTINKPIVMGRKTFESIGRYLPNRINIIISKTIKTRKITENAIFLSSLDDISKLMKKFNQEIVVIGGGEIYRQLIHISSRLYLTHINIRLNGDVFFPHYNSEEWLTIMSKTRNNIYYKYKFEVLERIK